MYWGSSLANPTFTFSYDISQFSSISSAQWIVGAGNVQGNDERLYLDETLIWSDFPDQGPGGFGDCLADVH